MFLIQSTLVFFILGSLRLNGIAGDDVDEYHLDCYKNWIYSPQNGYCYYVSEDYTNYAVALESCLARQAFLVKVFSPEEHVAIVDMLKVLIFNNSINCNSMSDCSNFWVDLQLYSNNISDLTHWKWEDGWPALGTGMIQFPYFALQRLQCGVLMLKGQSGYYIDRSCKQPFRYICKAAQHNGCPTGYDLAPTVDTCFKILPRLVNYKEAKRGCEEDAEGSYLASITSKAENDAAQRYLQRRIAGHDIGCSTSLFSDQPFWLSGYSKNPQNCKGSFFWNPYEGYNRPMNYTNWNPRQPDCSNGAEHCVEMSPSYYYKWNDVSCLDRACALCEVVL